MSLMDLLFLALLTALHFVDQCASYCPSNCTCLQGNTKLRCVGIGATEVFSIPESFREAIEIMYEIGKCVPSSHLFCSVLVN